MGWCLVVAMVGWGGVRAVPTERLPAQWLCATSQGGSTHARPASTCFSLLHASCPLPAASPPPPHMHLHQQRMQLRKVGEAKEY